VTPADFKGSVDLALPEFVKARDAVAKLEKYKLRGRSTGTSSMPPTSTWRSPGSTGGRRPGVRPLRAQLNVGRPAACAPWGTGI